MARVLPAAVLCLLLLPMEAALLPFVGSPTWRADIALCTVLWLGVSDAGTLEGAVGAYLCGTIADLLYAVHPGLFALVALLLYVAVRIGSGVLDIRGPGGFAVLCGLGVLVQAALVFGLLSFAGQAWPADAVWSLLGGAGLTAACGAPIYLVLSWASRALERDDPSLLR